MITLDRRKNIRVRDRATLFNLLIGLNGYGVLGCDQPRTQRRKHHRAPLEADEHMEINVMRPQGNNAFSLQQSVS
ncbi:MAG: hypothetical protein ACLT98_07830 [Eggerthellaceae bacterium]